MSSGSCEINKTSNMKWTRKLKGSWITKPDKERRGWKTRHTSESSSISSLTSRSSWSMSLQYVCVQHEEQGRRRGGTWCSNQLQVWRGRYRRGPGGPREGRRIKVPEPYFVWYGLVGSSLYLKTTLVGTSAIKTCSSSGNWPSKNGLNPRNACVFGGLGEAGPSFRLFYDDPAARLCQLMKS